MMANKAKILAVTNADENKSSFAILAHQLKRLMPEYEWEIVPFYRVQQGTVCDVLLPLWWRPLSDGLKASVTVRRATVGAVFDAYSWTATKTGHGKMERALAEMDFLVVGNSAFHQGLHDRFTLPPSTVCQTGVDVSRFKLCPLPPTFTAGWAGNSKATQGNDMKGLGLVRRACEQAGIPLRVADSAGVEGDKVDYLDMVEWYAGITCLVIASETEGTPRTLLEVMGMGRPTCTTRVGLAPEIVLHGVNGCMVKRDVTSMADGLRWIRDRIGQAPREMQAAARLMAEAHDERLKVERWRAVIRVAMGVSYSVRPAPPAPARPAPPAPAPARPAAPQATPAPQRLEMEAEELLGRRMPLDRLQAEIDALEAAVEVQADRPTVLLLSSYRFLTRTVHLLRHLVAGYRFIIGGKDYRGPVDLVWSFYPFRDGEVAARYKKRGIPYVQSMRGQFWHMEQHLVGASVNSLRQADCITVLTASLANGLVERWPEFQDKWIVKAPNGGYVSQAKGQGARVIPEGTARPVIACATNFNFEEKRQGVDDLVAALGATDFTGSFLVAGNSGPHAPTAPKLGTRSRYVGFVRDRFQFCREADLFLYLSYMDGQPTCLIEAMSAGLPVVVGDVPGTGAGEFVRNGETGLLFKTPEQGVKLALDLLKQPGRMKAMGAAGQAWVERHLTWSETARTFDGIFHTLIK
jgi:glycosyltransferase involved in cell wall biosynthesis